MSVSETFVVMFHILSIVILELKPAIYFHLSLT